MISDTKKGLNRSKRAREPRLPARPVMSPPVASAFDCARAGTGCAQQGAAARPGRPQKAVDAGEIGGKRPCRNYFFDTGGNRGRSIFDHDRGGMSPRGDTESGGTPRREYVAVIGNNDCARIAGRYEIRAQGIRRSEDQECEESQYPFHNMKLRSFPANCHRWVPEIMDSESAGWAGMRESSGRKSS